MSLVVPNLSVGSLVKGSDFNYKAQVVVASAPNTNWTTTAVLNVSTVDGVDQITLTNLTAGVSLGQLDGYEPSVGDRILIKDLATIFNPVSGDSTYNGIYTVLGGDPTGFSALRDYDMSNGDSATGATCWVTNGVTQSNTGWYQTAEGNVGTVTPVFQQYDVVDTLAAGRGGTGVTTFGGTNTLLYTSATDTLTSLATANDSVLTTNGSGVPTWESKTNTTIDHGGLEGLADDDHTQYALLAGRSGGQVLTGGTGASEILVLSSTSNATKGIVRVSDELRVNSIIDTQTEPLLLGGTNATKVEIGKSGATTEIKGDLLVSGTTTSINSEVVNIADNYLYLNDGYTTDAAQTGGIVVNYDPTTTTTTADTGGFGTTSTVTVVSIAGFGVADIIQISGADNQANDGIYEISAVAGTTITIDTTPQEDFSQTGFTVDATDTSAVITKVAVSVIRTNTSGDWQTGKGSTVPISYTTLSTSTPKNILSILPQQVEVNTTTATTIAYLAWDDSDYGSASTRTLTFWHDNVTNRDLTVAVFDGINTSTTTISSPTPFGIGTLSIIDPGVDARLEIRVNKDLNGGTNPTIYGIQLTLQ